MSDAFDPHRSAGGTMSEAARQVVKMEREEALPAVSETAAILQVIERAARDPSVDIDKLQQLMAMRERVEARRAETAFDAAMAQAQAEMRPVAADASNPQTRSKYASYAALDRAVRPIYTRHGFSLSFGTGAALADQVLVLCRVAHRDGHARDYSVPMPADGKGAKGGDVMTKTHATGSAITYGMRYLLKMIFNIAVGGDPDDDDGNSAGGQANGNGARKAAPITDRPISKQELADLQKLIDETASDAEKLCKYLHVESLAALSAAGFEEAKRALEHKRDMDKAKGRR